MCRGLIETLPDHNIDTFIALSTPQGGQYGGKVYIYVTILVTLLIFLNASGFRNVP